MHMYVHMSREPICICRCVYMEMSTSAHCIYICTYVDLCMYMFACMHVYFSLLLHLGRFWCFLKAICCIQMSELVQWCAVCTTQTHTVFKQKIICVFEAQISRHQGATPGQVLHGGLEIPYQDGWKGKTKTTIPTCKHDWAWSATRKLQAGAASSFFPMAMSI